MSALIDPSSPGTRRKFLGMMTAAGMAAATSNLLGGEIKARQSTAPKGNTVPKLTNPVTHTIPASDFTGVSGSSIDFQVLNFALTLEFLEADLYRQALNLASGFKLSRPLDADRSIYKRNVMVDGLSSGEANVAFVYLRDFTYVEAAHRDFLIAAIRQAGGTPTTANAKGYKFVKMPDASMRAILEAILPLEETGVRAYLGAIRSFTSYQLAQVAGTIYSTECRHSAAIRLILGQEEGPSKMGGDLSDPSVRMSEDAYEYYLEPQTVLAAASVYFVK